MNMEVCEEDENNELGEGVPSQSKEKRKVYLPGSAPLGDDEELVHDPSAYTMLHEAQTRAPCLSFDIIKDGLGSDRYGFPHTAYIVCGTQSDRPNGNSIIVMKASQLHSTQKPASEDSSDDSESESDEDDDEAGKKAVMEFELIKHYGCVNRIRTTMYKETALAATWSEMGKVSIYDISAQLQAIEDPSTIDPAAHKKKKKGVGELMRPRFTFSDHKDEGYGIDWSPCEPGLLATGDCKGILHVRIPGNSGGWATGGPLLGHTDSVEDIQWSPNEKNVLATCSVDKSLRIWDTRDNMQRSKSACQLTIENAHSTDINVISWNRKEPLIASGGDDGILKFWDLRQFEAGKEIAILKHHTDAITSVEWCPQESSVVASSGADNQIALWDLAVENDREFAEPELKNIPQQLLFIHQGQTDIKELHWHPQIPGMIISTANSGFNFFKTISV